LCHFFVSLISFCIPALNCRKILKNLMPPNLWYSAYSDWVSLNVMALPCSVFSFIFHVPDVNSQAINRILTKAS
jgi:hypothetical protein